METSITSEQLGNFGVYEHASLTDRDAIRLLELYPDPRNQSLKGKLRCVRLSDAQKQYSALSYTREHSIKEYSIILDDQPFTICGNLHQFLASIRRTDKALTLWVDEICIDKTSNSEKAQQARLTGSIFENAKDTLIGLGEEPNDMKALFAVAQNSATLLKDPEFADIAQKSRGLYGDLLPDVIDEACLHLLGKKYWTQACVAQELFSASPNLVSCGEEILPWKLFSVSVRSYLGLVSYHKWPKELGYYLEKFLKQLFQPIPPNWYANDFPSLLQISYSSGCTVPRDRIFALLSLIHKEDDPLFMGVLKDQVSTTIEQIIDYDISSEDLFWKILHLYESDGLVPLHFAISLFRALELADCDLSNSELNTPERDVCVEFRTDLVEKNVPKQDLYYNLNGHLHACLQTGGHPHPGRAPLLLDRVWLLPSADEPPRTQKLCLGSIRRPFISSAAVTRAFQPIFEANVQVDNVWEHNDRQAYLGRLKLSLKLIQALSRLDRMLESYRAEGYGRGIKMLSFGHKGDCGMHDDKGLPGQTSPKTSRPA